MARWLMVRHGESEWNLEGKAQGHADIALTERGREQARALGRVLSKVTIHVAATSDLSRARETARLVLGEREVPMEVTRDLREVNYGEWEGLTSEQAKQRNPELHAQWLLWDPEFVAPGGETVEQLTTRVKRFVKSMEGLGEDKTLLVVAHGGTLRVLAMVLLGLHRSSFRQFLLDNASLSIIDVYEQRSVLSLWNDTSHYQRMYEW